MSRTYRSTMQAYYNITNADNYIKYHYSKVYRSFHKWIVQNEITDDDIRKEFKKLSRDGKSYKRGGNKVLRELSNSYTRSMDKHDMWIIKKDPEAYDNMIPSCDKHTKHFHWVVW